MSRGDCPRASLPTSARSVYLITHLIGAAASPLVVAVLLAVVGLLCRAAGRVRAARAIAVAAVAIGYLGCLIPVGTSLLKPLERIYLPLREDAPLPRLTDIVVLGSGYSPGGGLPVTAALDDDGLARVVEGVRLARSLAGARLIVSGGALPGHAAPARGYAIMARELGVSEASITVLDRALDTKEEARDVTALLGSTPFILVTSASHMPRAMQLMQRAGAHPFPAPTGQRGLRHHDAGLRLVLPTSEGLGMSERALHEYLGLAAIRLGLD
jgi:uncharacterized SAM-binding protein YcdF (DUF218 family)